MALLTAAQVMEVLGVQKTKAYSIINDLNAELSDAGYYIIRGRVEERYLMDRFRLSEGNSSEHNNV